MASTQKGFCIGSTFGQMSFYERTDDKREPYIEVRSISLGPEHDICGINLLPSEGIVAAMTTAGRVLSIPSEMNIRPGSSEEDDEDEEKLIGSDVSDFSYGGNHTGAITGAAVAKERSIIATLCPHDNTLRVWNYETKKCELKHDFGSDEPVSVTMHANGMFPGGLQGQTAGIQRGHGSTQALQGGGDPEGVQANPVLEQWSVHSSL